MRAACSKPAWRGRGTSPTTAGVATRDTLPGSCGRPHRRRIPRRGRRTGDRAPYLGRLAVHRSRPLPAAGRGRQPPRSPARDRPRSRFPLELAPHEARRGTPPAGVPVAKTTPGRRTRSRIGVTAVWHRQQSTSPMLWDYPCPKGLVVR